MPREPLSLTSPITSSVFQNKMGGEEEGAEKGEKEEDEESELEE